MGVVHPRGKTAPNPQAISDAEAPPRTLPFPSESTRKKQGEADNALIPFALVPRHFATLFYLANFLFTLASINRLLLSTIVAAPSTGRSTITTG